MIFNDNDIERFLRLIYTGKSTEYALDEGMYYAIADYLKKGLYDGYGISLNELSKSLKEGIATAFDTSDLALLTELRENIYMFSSAKLFQETKDFTGALIGEDGQVRSFKEFKEFATPINNQWNENWLRTEYETAYGQAQNAVRWNEIEKNKDVLPLLKYSAVEDDRTSEICAPLDGVTLPVDDPFWDTFMPLNHFNCRCTVEQLMDGDETSKDKVEGLTQSSGGEMNDMFKMNPGKDKVVFDKEHPYFDVEKKDKEFAKENFGLPIPEED